MTMLLAESNHVLSQTKYSDLMEENNEAKHLSTAAPRAYTGSSFKRRILVETEQQMERHHLASYFCTRNSRIWVQGQLGVKSANKH